MQIHVGMGQRVEEAEGQQGRKTQSDVLGLCLLVQSLYLVADEHSVAAPDEGQALCDLKPLHLVGIGGAGGGSELCKAVLHFRVDAARVVSSGQGDSLIFSANPVFDSRKQYMPVHMFHVGNKKAVVAPGMHARRGGRGKIAEIVCLEPFAFHIRLQFLVYACSAIHEMLLGKGLPCIPWPLPA